MEDSKTPDRSSVETRIREREQPVVQREDSKLKLSSRELAFETWGKNEMEQGTKQLHCQRSFLARCSPKCVCVYTSHITVCIIGDRALCVVEGSSLIQLPPPCFLCVVTE